MPLGSISTSISGNIDFVFDKTINSYKIISGSFPNNYRLTIMEGSVLDIKITGVKVALSSDVVIALTFADAVINLVYRNQ